jgi:NADH:ubiquinone oxidoreductase subunit F (NADH-binding)
VISESHWLVPERPIESYGAYLEFLGGSAIERARDLDGVSIVDELERSKLRGRGGAGFPTGMKWRTLLEHSCKKRYVVCNAAEGEPGTFKDRFLLRKNVYAPLEGLLIAAHALGTTDVHIALKKSFVPELARIRSALEELAVAGLLDGIEVTVTEGPEEYLVGEEKALLNVIEGIGPLPREAHYSPYERGLFGTAVSPNSALVNNAETYAHVATILRHDPSPRSFATAPRRFSNSVRQTLPGL